MRLKELLQGKIKRRQYRSKAWVKVSDNFIAANPKCAVCGGIKDLHAHHIKPFHLYPELELEPSNLMTLCESKRHGINCHLLVGHLGDFRRENQRVREDAYYLAERLRRED